jgi:DNA polymerase-4
MNMKIILHVDMNSYFASVEQQANPFLRGKPVAICSRLSPYACIIACSIEAKKLGIKTGFNLHDARKLAPNIVALEVDPPKIRAVTDRVFAIFADYTSAIEAYSIDEAFLDVTGFVVDFSAARELALVIKARIKDEVGDWLRCSIGISHTRWLAKFAGELQKPDGLTILNKKDLGDVYRERAVDEAWGIADGWKMRLASIGVNTLGDLLTYNPLELKRRFGMPGYMIWANIAGLDIEQVRPIDNSAPKSIGHSYVFHKRTAEARQISAIMMKLCERVGRRLRHLNMETRRVSVGWGLTADSGLAPRSRSEVGNGNSTRCFDPIFESYDIFSAAWRPFCALWDHSIITSLAVTASDLLPVSNQTSIFNDRAERQNISAALDAVNDRYGDYTIIRGQMWGVSESAPERIGFRKTIEPIWRGEKTSTGDY